MSYITISTDNTNPVGNPNFKWATEPSSYFESFKDCALLKIDTHASVEPQIFIEYFKNKKFFVVDEYKLREIRYKLNLFFDDYRLSNKILQSEYGMRYAGYQYFWDYENSNAKYNNFLVIKNQKKFNYARIKFEI